MKRAFKVKILADHELFRCQKNDLRAIRLMNLIPDWKFRVSPNRFTCWTFFPVLIFILLFPFSLWASVSISNISVSNSNPSPGSTLGVTVSYCETNSNTSPFFLVALNPNSSNIQPCPASGQVLLVDECTGNVGANPVASSVAAVTDACGGNGWGGTQTGNSGGACATQIFNVTIPLSTGPGTTNLIVVAGDYWVQCNQNITGNIVTQLTIPLPPPSCAPLTVMTEGVTASPEGLYLFDVDYSFVNSGATSIVYTLPNNVTVQSAGPNAVTTSTNVTWNMGNVTLPQIGVVWALVSVNPGTTGAVIPNSATLYSAGCGNNTSGTVNVTVQNPQISLLKSQSASSLSAGSAVTYTLDWTATGSNLQLYDSYDYDFLGSSTSDGSNVTGWDGTQYTDIPAASDPGTWTIGSDGQGNQFIVGSTVPYNLGTHGHYPELLRNIPGSDICNNIIVQGDMEIPVSITNNCSGCGASADAHMVIACNPSQGITLKAGISIDSNPGNLFVQFNNDYNNVTWSALANSTLPFTISTGVWYTVRSQIIFSNGSSAVSFIETIWPTGQPGNSKNVTFYINSTVDTNSDFVLPTCSGGWRAGWEVAETAGTDWYSNLKIYGPGPILNASVTDMVPTGVSYLNSNEPNSVLGTNPDPQTLVWSSPSAFPATMYSFDTTIQWWGTVACPGPFVNTFTMASPSFSGAVTSNSVTLAISGSCGPTNTPTQTASPTATGTPSPTATPTTTSCGPGTAADFTWSTMAPMPTARNRFGAGVVNGILYAVGGENLGTHNGLNVVEAYNPTTNTWATMAPMPTGRQSFGMVANNGILYAVGGMTTSGTILSSVEAYDPLTNTWTTKASMPTARKDLTLGEVNGILYAVGGDDGVSSLSTVEAYDPSTNVWTTKAPMLTALNEMGVDAVNGVLYVVGGQTCVSAVCGVVNSVQAYDPTTNTWTMKASMSTKRVSPTAQAINGILYVAGGDDTVNFLNTLEAYDPSVNSWSPRTSMPTARGGFVDGFINGVLYEVGGYNGSFLSVNEAGTLTCFAIPTATFTPTPTPTMPPPPSFTPTITVTPTITNTSTVTNTPTVSPTLTATPPGLHLWPNPFNPTYAHNKTLKVYQAFGGVLTIYTVSGELVATAKADDNGLIQWDGRNKFGVNVAGGIYYYIVTTGGTTGTPLLNGTLLVIRN
jgi:N-acetylneuraminic acid mutarotase